ncbi:helix-turn-helix domain-containing protein [Ensifer sp. YR511]|uniref:AlbA family DNA-binding domain-containing protein n=1 Tax=Ensifer sp. YR511 TaxID=1855294 RepID=UPI0015A2207B|nr:ATP-binding protein [Ensifer sp. YR511]
MQLLLPDVFDLKILLLKGALLKRALISSRQNEMLPTEFVGKYCEAFRMSERAAPPTIDSITSGLVTEGQHYEFKARLNLEEQRGKSNFIDDIVAFLNSGPGYLVVGVYEKKGAFERFDPLDGDRDALQRRITSIIQDNIEPKPLGVRLEFLDLDSSGFVLCLELPDHRLRPYQNKITGGFYLRTGAQNTPIPRDQLHALFTPIEKLEADTAKLMERENTAIETRDIMQKNGATLHIAIVPQEHYERERAPFDPGRGVLKRMRYYHAEDGGIYKGCEDGVEVLEKTFQEGRSISRFFIGDDWLTHSYVSHPFAVRKGEGRLTLHEFRPAFARYMGDIQRVFDDAGIRGPFGVLFAVKNLQRNPDLKWAFPNASAASIGRPIRVARVDDPVLLDRFYEKVSSVTVYGR